MNKYDSGQVILITLFAIIISFFLGIGFGTNFYKQKHINNQKNLPIVGEQYYHVDKDNPFEQDTIKILITDVRTNRNGELWVEYHHYYSKDGSIIEEPCTKDWKFIENLFEKYE